MNIDLEYQNKQLGQIKELLSKTYEKDHKTFEVKFKTVDSDNIEKTLNSLTKLNEKNLEVINYSKEQTDKSNELLREIEVKIADLLKTTNDKNNDDIKEAIQGSQIDYKKLKVEESIKGLQDIQETLKNAIKAIKSLKDIETEEYTYEVQRDRDKRIIKYIENYKKYKVIETIRRDRDGYITGGETNVFTN